MTETKNLKVPIQTHEMLKKRANALGVKHYVMAEAILLLGLKLTDREIQEAVVNAQLMQQTTNTTSEAPPEKP